MSESEQQAPS